MTALETFFRDHQYTIAAFSAVSTFLAVVVSLTIAIIAQRASRTKIKARAQITIVLHSSLEGKKTPTYVTAEITNTGVMSVSIPLSFFRFTVPFKTGVWMLNPLDFSATDEWVQQKQYPVEIAPRHAKVFTLQEISMFHEMMLANFLSGSALNRLRGRFLRAKILTDDGRIFNVKLESTFRKEVRELRKKRVTRAS